MYWLPTSFPANVKVVLTTNISDTNNIMATHDKVKVTSLEIPILGPEEKRNLCLVSRI